MINKYDKTARPIDLSWTTYIPKNPELDVAGFDSVLQQQQGQYDQVSLLSEKKPNVLNNEEDWKLYNDYKKSTDAGLNEVANAYTKGVTQGQLAYKNFLNQVRKDWSPGGKADILNQRYTQYQTALKNIDDFYKDDPSPVNKTLAKQGLANQLKNPIIQDPSTGQYSSISSPELHKNPDINKAIDEMLKEIKANGDTTFLGEDKDWWIKKIQTETREPERIKLAYQALSNQPEYASQINRDAQYRALATNPEEHKARFEQKQNNALKSIESLANKATSDPNATTELQQLLRNEGYNVTVDGKYGPQTKNAASELLKQKKQDVQDNINSYDFNSQLREDVNQSYLGYALRGAYQKRDIDLVFNQAKKALLDDARKREENQINRDRLNFEYQSKDQSQILVADGLAQQLPEIQKYAEDAKVNRDQLKQKLNQALNKSDVFRGWKLENVGEAYMKWLKVTGNSEDEKKANFKAMLNDGDYKFSDQQVQSLYEQMMAPESASSIKTMLKGYGEANNEVQRVDEGLSYVAEQYSQTTEGKKTIARLRERMPQEFQNLSDNQLLQKAIFNPDQFEVNTSKASSVGGMSVVDFPNPAEQAKQAMFGDVKKQIKEGKNYNWGSLGTFEIYAGTKDNTLKPIFDMTAQAIETGEGGNFSSFGLMGLNFKDNKGNSVEGETKKVGKIAVAKNIKGEPILKVGATITLPNGKTKDGYTEVALVPGSALQREYTKSLKEAYIQKVQAGENPQAAGILDALQAIEGDFGTKNAAMDVQLSKLNLKNTKDDDLLLFNPNSKTFTPISNLGWQSKDLLDDEVVAGRYYKTYGLNTPTGNFAANVIVDDQGRKIIVPSETGYTYNSTSGISKDRKAKEILSQADVIVTKTKQ